MVEYEPYNFPNCTLWLNTPENNVQICCISNMEFIMVMLLIIGTCQITQTVMMAYNIYKSRG